MAEAGLGQGPFTVRLTDVHGQQLVHTGITPAPGVVQTRLVPVRPPLTHPLDRGVMPS